MLSMSMSMTPEDKFQKAIIKLQKSRPFFSVIVMRMNSRQCMNDSIPTMTINEFGDLFWNPVFVDELGKNGYDQLLYVLCHEAMHLAKGDLFRIGERNLAIWNIATDCIINDILNNEGLTPPKFTEKILENIKETKTEGFEKEGEQKKPGDVLGIQPDSKGDIEIGGKTYNVRGKSDEQLYDELIEDAEFIEMSLGISSGFGDGDDQNQSNQSAKGHGGFDCHILGNKNEKGESASSEKSGEKEKGKNGIGVSQKDRNANRDKWRKVVTEAATVAKMRGELPGFAETLLDAVLQPKVDWQARIRSFITNEIPHDFHNRFPNRKFHSTGVWMPCIFNENVRIFVSIDCSGSTAPVRNEFASEVVGIITAHPAVKAKLICWDTRVNPKNVFDVTTNTIDEFQKVKLEDISGGTELTAYTNYLEKQQLSSRVHIHLTDGYIESKPILPDGRHLFVICPGGSDEILKDYGECIYMDSSKYT